MNYLFLHQNAPAQFRHIAARLAKDQTNRVVYVTQPGKQRLAGVDHVEYRPHRTAHESTHHYLRPAETAVINGQGVAKALIALRDRGFEPDVVIGHPGWGETLFVKDIYPDVPLVSYCEFYYNARGANIGFDPEYPEHAEIAFRTRMRNAHHLVAAEAADALYAPTAWQRQQFPETLRDRIEVIHDGIDCSVVKPDAKATFDVAGGVLRAGDPVVTYVARNLEPYRGFHTFMRALPRILSERPDVQVVVVGGDEVSYGRAAPPGRTYRDLLTREVDLPEGRVHFLGKIPYAQYVRLLQISAVHIYLTYPFVLSWSCLEAMAAGCRIVGSRTAPVEEVITDGETGVLVDFFSADEVAERALEVLGREVPAVEDTLGAAARQTVMERFELQDCLDRLDALIAGVARRG
ncbi:glycosyltransferase family 4 protein [Pontivivens ytuae]|uniref:Glycosyltransferase family 4 protein n=1 Tax=Pontivivens ytuae TaxID=2789856 RepID=A0A7S9LNV7_9RHOB|nr:glycosyltransferase family 4 protein [Pontivivens ytuae]QPH52543.1 glycosyltransferase family 4 protein [Pontivivens ytuae]